MKGNSKNADTEGSSRKETGTMDFILIIVGAALLAFTVTMIAIFLVMGSIPDTLCTCVFAALGGECGVMGWIKTTKEKRKDREWQLEDEERNKNQHEDPGMDDMPRCDK